MKQVYLDIAGRMHSMYRELVDYPPEGYHFVTQGTGWDRVSSAVSKANTLYSFQQWFLGKFIPVNLTKAYLERFKKPPQGTDLTYATGHLVFRKERWVMDLEVVTQLTGYSFPHLKRYRKLVERVLASEYSKKIICPFDIVAKTVLLNLDCRGFEDKIEVVPIAVRQRNFVKASNKDKVKLLFIGSVNMPRGFDTRGGKETLEAFVILTNRYPRLELVIRSDVPRNIKDRYQQVNNIKFIDRVIPWSQMEEEFKSADIYLFPSYHSQFMATLDAMSYELPIIITDTWVNPELVEDGKTGFLIRKSEKIPDYVGNYIPPVGTPQFEGAWNTIDYKVVEELVEKTSILIENEELRRRMGKAGREKIESGKFSIENRNQMLKRIFDEATA